MIGAIIGDIVGSRWEFHPIKTKVFPLFTSGRNRFTDDTVMTLAVAEALLTGQRGAVLAKTTTQLMQAAAQDYPHRGYGRSFRQWLKATHPRPYRSFGNGAAMRVSACAYAADTLEEVKRLAFTVTAITHNHHEGLKGAEATVVAIFMARQGASKDEIRAEIEKHYYPLGFTLSQIRPGYEFNETCQGSVPQGIRCFLEAKSFEDALRNAVSLGGDADTLAAIAGSIAEAYFGVPEQLRNTALTYLDEHQKALIDRFEAAFPQSLIPARRG